MVSQTTMHIVPRAWPEQGEPRAADFSEMYRKVVVGGRRIQRREAMEGVEPTAPGG